MEAPPRPDRWDVAAWAGAATIIAGAYLVVGHPQVTYGAWLAVFCIWMAWFVYYGTRWIYGVPE